MRERDELSETQPECGEQFLAGSGAIFGAVVAGPPSGSGGSSWAVNSGPSPVRFLLPSP